LTLSEGSRQPRSFKRAIAIAALEGLIIMVGFINGGYHFSAMGLVRGMNVNEKMLTHSLFNRSYELNCIIMSQLH
jgi:hypothetical protein